jgi:hypothetical protein
MDSSLYHYEAVREVDSLFFVSHQQVVSDPLWGYGCILERIFDFREKARREGDTAIKRMIDNALDGTSVTVVCVGYQTANRRYVNYEIEKSLERGNGLVAVQIHHLKDENGQTDFPGSIPSRITQAGFKAYQYVDAASLARWIDEAARIAGK